MDFNKLFLQGITENTIKESYLKRIPSLKTCDNWKKVEEVGLIDHKTRLVYYKGGIVKLGNNFYYVTSERIQATGYYRTWNFTKKLKVV